MGDRNYLWLSNSSIPSEEKLLSREDIYLGNVSRPWVSKAIDMGYTAYVGINRKYAEELKSDLNARFFYAGIYRNLFDLKRNYKAYQNVKRVLQKEEFDVIHCNTPIGGVLGRLCGRKEKVPKVIYTVHGFHFYKGAPLINRTVLKWAEQWMARYTDTIITINQEDYQTASKLKLRKGGKVYYLPGVGVNTKDYQMVGFDKASMRASLGLGEEDVVLIAMGDLIKRKNYEASIRAIAKANNPRLRFLICGRGPKLDELKQLSVELGVDNKVHFLGFRKDIKDLLQIADIFLFTTYQEGLPRSMMEAMSAGLPCIASKIRGNVDLIEDGKGGYLCAPDDVEGFAKAIDTLAADETLRLKMTASNLKTIESFDIKNIEKIAAEIYAEQL